MYACSNLVPEYYIMLRVLLSPSSRDMSIYFVTSAISVNQILRQMLKAPVEQ
jgi:hypothetical protein